MLRTFIAVKIAPTPELRSLLSDLGELHGPLKPVAAEKLHVTLKFLGDTADETVPQVGDAFRKAAEGKPACDVLLSGLSAFPHPGRPSIVWVGMQSAEILVELASELETALALLGFERETRPFQPHLTLARVNAKPPRELGAYLQQHTATEYGMAHIDAVEFLRSELLPQGPRYSVLATAKLGQTSL